MKMIYLALILGMFAGPARAGTDVDVSTSPAAGAELAPSASEKVLRPVVLRDRDQEIVAAAGDINDDTRAVSGDLEDQTSNVARRNSRR
jgi:hypothetical protein